MPPEKGKRGTRARVRRETRGKGGGMGRVRGHTREEEEARKMEEETRQFRRLRGRDQEDLLPKQPPEGGNPNRLIA